MDYSQLFAAANAARQNPYASAIAAIPYIQFLAFALSKSNKEECTDLNTLWG
jgi:formiminotetrahydrofolate cyclodeaminase